MKISTGTEYGGDVLCWTPDSRGVVFVQNHETSAAAPFWQTPAHARVQTSQDSLRGGPLNSVDNSLFGKYQSVSGVFLALVDEDNEDEERLRLLCETKGSAVEPVFRPFTTALLAQGENCKTSSQTLVAFVTENSRDRRMHLHLGRLDKKSGKFDTREVATPSRWTFVYDPILSPTDPNGTMAAVVWEKPDMHWDRSYIMIVQDKQDFSRPGSGT
jgi:hypothetical protein